MELGGWTHMWFTVVQVTTQLGTPLIYLPAPPWLSTDVFTKSITHISRPDIRVSSYITHVLLIYAPPSIMRDICRDNHRCADRAYVSWASLVGGSLFRHRHHLYFDVAGTNIYSTRRQCCWPQTTFVQSRVLAILIRVHHCFYSVRLAQLAQR